MKKSDFLNYLSSVLDNKDSAYYDEQEQYFYFYHNHFTFQLKSNPGAAFLVVLEEKSVSVRGGENETIPLTADEAILLMDKVIPLIPTNQQDYQDKKEKIGVDNFNSYIDLLDEYLKNYNPVGDIQTHLKKGSLDNYIVYFPLDGINHICRIGKVARYDGKKEHLLTSVVKIPFFLLDSPEPKSGCIPYDLIIPSWKIKEYPILENFIEPKIFGADFEDTFENMVRKFTHGKELFKEVLDSKMPELNKKTKPRKI